MKKTLIVALAILALAPYAAEAAWWNPFGWGKSPRPAVVSDNADQAATSSESTDGLSVLPTTDELYRRIAELEGKIDVLRAQLAEAREGKSTPAPVVAVVDVEADSPRDLSANGKASVVLVEGPKGTSAGSVIDAKGFIVTTSKILGTSTSATVVLSSGAKRQAHLIGLEVANNVAVLQLSDAKASSYASYRTGALPSVGDTLYMVGFNVGGVSASAIPAVVAQNSASSFQVTVESKPFDTSVLVTSNGSLVAIPSSSSCKVLEEGRTCLKYAVSATVSSSRIPLLAQGLRLYGPSKVPTKEEEAFRGYIESLYRAVTDATSVTSAIDAVSGKNSFDFLNGRLADDENGKIARLYATKLKNAADSLSRAYDSLRSASYTFRTGLINDSALTIYLNGYQRKTIQALQAENDARLKKYQEQMDFWTRKKNEYDSYISAPDKATHDLLMTEGVFVESGAGTLSKERQRILESLSSDVRGQF